MQIVLDVKNPHNVLHPQRNTVILYDGKEWYVTSKEKLFSDWTNLLNESKKTLQNLEQQNKNFKLEVSRQLQEMSELIEKLFTDKENEGL